MWEDPIVEEVRKIREEHAAKFKYDLDAIYRDLKEQDKTRPTAGGFIAAQTAGDGARAFVSVSLC